MAINYDIHSFQIIDDEFWVQSRYSGTPVLICVIVGILIGMALFMQKGEDRMARQQSTNKPKKTLPVVKLEKRSIETRERINKWVDAQKNYSASIIAIIEHMIERFGYVDIMDHEIAKKLYNEKGDIQLEITTNKNSLTYDSKEETNIETPVAEKKPEMTDKEANGNQTIIIEIDPQSKILLIRDGSEKEVSYKF